MVKNVLPARAPPYTHPVSLVSSCRKCAIATRCNARHARRLVTRVEIHNASRRMSHDYRLNAGLARVLDIRA